METRRLHVSQIQRAPYNPRVALKPSDPEYQNIKASLLTYGMVEPLVWNERTGNLVGGDQRFNIWTGELKHDEIDVSVVDLPIEQEKALNIALNKVSGRWDNDKLAELIHDLTAQPVEIATLGFNDAEMNDLFRRYEVSHAGDFLNEILGAPAPVGGYTAAAPDEDDGDEDDDPQTPRYAAPPAPQWTPAYQPTTPAGVAATAPAVSDPTITLNSDGSVTPAPLAGPVAGSPETGMPAAPGLPPVQYYQLTFAVTLEQRNIVQEALQRARDFFNVRNSIEALVAMSASFLNSLDANDAEQNEQNEQAGQDE